MPELIRTFDDRCRSSMAESGSTTIPVPSVMVKGNCPFWCEVPRN